MWGALEALGGAVLPSFRPHGNTGFRATTWPRPGRVGGNSAASGTE